jgi:hypothetical protein
MFARANLVVLAFAAVAIASALGAGCPGKDDTKRVLGTDGRERWVVTFEGNEPDLAEYRALLKDKPDEAEAYAEKMRKKLETDHEDLAKVLESLNGRIVERWWMSQSVTVEIDATAAPSLEKVAGVKSLTPDVPLEP